MFPLKLSLLASESVSSNMFNMNAGSEDNSACHFVNIEGEREGLNKLGRD